MATLQDMIRHKLINAGDSITFTFKGNVFGASILNGGFIGKCTIKRVHDTDAEEYLKANHSTFSSLTAWTEACLQDMWRNIIQDLLKLEESDTQRVKTSR